MKQQKYNMRYIKADGSVDAVYKNINEPTLEVLQRKVGGYIQNISPSTHYYLYVDEEAKLKPNQLINNKASEMVGYKVYGDVVIVQPLCEYKPFTK